MAGLGIFGGTFDPPHLGHLIMAAEAYHQLNLDRLLWVLTPDPPHKQNHRISPLHHRLDMLRATLTGNPQFELSPVDINRHGPHYAIDTVRILKEMMPGVDWYYLMGGDSLIDLHTWRKPHKLLASITALGVVVRPGAEIDLTSLELKIPGVSAKVIFIQAPLIGISASEIRLRVANGLPYRYLVPPEVYEIIRERGLYQIR